jgi:hypothetical protein
MKAAGFIMIRDTADDILLRNVGPNRDEVLPLNRGTRVVVDLIGLRASTRLIRLVLCRS